MSDNHQSISAPDDQVATVLQIVRTVLAKGNAALATLPSDDRNRENLEALLSDLAQLESFSFHLAKGDLSPEFNMRGKMAGNLKKLQANMRHITWQARQITLGDYSQRLNFLGEFSDSFNTMVEKLETARAQRELHEQALSEKNRELAGEIEERRRIAEELAVSLENLKKSEERYRAMADFSDHGIFILSREFLIVYANKVASAYMTVIPTEVTVQSVDDIHPPLLAKRLRSFLDPVFTTGKGFTGTTEISSEGLQRWLETTIIPLIREHTSPVEAMVLIHDITERVMMEKQMEKEGIRQIEKNMEQFQILNDQIRNPLQAILGLSVLQGGQYTDKITKEVETIDSLVTRLDQGWVESEKVRRFLLEHYRHGGDLDNDTGS